MPGRSTSVTTSRSSWSSCFFDTWAQLPPTFLPKYWQKRNKVRSTMIVFVPFNELMCSDSIFNLLKRVFIFLPILNLGAQIRWPQNWYAELKSALLPQPLKVAGLGYFLVNFAKFSRTPFLIENSGGSFSNLTKLPNNLYPNKFIQIKTETKQNLKHLLKTSFQK